MSRQQGKEPKKPWERTSVLIGGVGGLIAVFVAVSQQRPAASLAIATAILLLGGWSVVFLMTAKITRNRLRFPRVRWVATAAAVLVLALIGVGMAVPATRAILIRDVLGFPSIKDEVRVEQVWVTESQADYRIGIVVRNNRAREELVKTVKLVTRCPPRPEAPAARTDVYDVLQEFRIGTIPGAQLSGDVLPPNEDEYRAPVIGKLIDDDCGKVISLWFGVSRPLPSNQHTTMIVDLPKTLKVPYNGPVPEGAPAESTTIDLAIRRPDAENFVVTLKVADVEISGSPD